MELFGEVDWQALLLPQTPLLETFLRGSLIYILLFLTLRLLLKREAGIVGITDLLMVLLISEAASNALADDYRSIPDGLLLVLTIILWSYLFNWLGYRFKSLQHLVHQPPLPLIKQGTLLRRNMRHELITQEELLSQIRQQGIEQIEQVKLAYIEGDGHISVIPFEQPPKGQSPKRKQVS